MKRVYISFTKPFFKRVFWMYFKQNSDVLKKYKETDYEQ